MEWTCSVDTEYVQSRIQLILGFGFPLAWHSRFAVDPILIIISSVGSALSILGGTITSREAVYNKHRNGQQVNAT